jgi:prepilin-type N-terminal cleavage/methylation domain-containing protein
MKDIKTSAKNKGFTLVEIIAVMTVIGILFGVMLLPFLGIIENAQMRAERQKVAALAAEIKMSFRQDDFYKNISAVVGDMPNYTTGGPYETTFDYGTPAGNESVIGTAWYARLASLRGQGFGSGELASKTGDIYEIAYNSKKVRRVLLAGPREMNQQRYLLLSFMFNDGPALPNAPGPRGAMVDGSFVPVADYASWFNAMYEHTWGETSDAPTSGEGWVGSGTTLQAAWNHKGARGRSYAERVVAERITQPRYRVVVNNNSPRTESKLKPGLFIEPDRVYVYGNMLAWTDWKSTMDTPGVAERVDAVESPGAVGGRPENVVMLPKNGYGFLEGRRVVITRQRDAATVAPGDADPVLSVLINENITYTAQ